MEKRVVARYAVHTDSSLWQLIGHLPGISHAPFFHRSSAAGSLWYRDLQYNTGNNYNYINSAAQVDHSCSGLKGVWSGLLFFFGATWIEQKRLNFKWFISLILFLGTLTAFNVLRIVILVITETALGMPKTAAVIPIPLGVTGFVFSCIFAWFMLISISDKESKKRSQASPKKLRRDKPNSKLCFFIIMFLFCGVWVNQKESPVDFTPHTKNNFKLQLPPSFCLKPVPLTKLENSFLLKNRKDWAVKKRFNWNHISGTILIALNNNWRRHHSPEECLIGGGLKINKTATYLINSNFPVKTASFQDRELSTSYWFQSPTFTTDDFTSRIWAEILGREKNWVLVSIMFDKKINLETKEMKGFHLTIFQEMKRILVPNS